QELIMRARMVPVGPMFRQYARTVRDTAAIHGKNAHLITAGDDVEIDTTAVELLRDPITHMIRNAIDHGIEPSSERVAKGKSPVGAGTPFTIRLPLTLAVIEGFGVAAGDETWIVPMESVVECVELPADEPREEATGVLLLRDEVVPYVRVRKLFGTQVPSPRE